MKSKEKHQGGYRDYRTETEKLNTEALGRTEKWADYGREETKLFEKLITVEDLADAFGFAPQTVRNWVALRKIPFIRIGGKTRFRHGTVMAWLAQKEFKSCR